MAGVTAYAAFLRGINLGPTNKVAMPRLREIAEGLGWNDVRTYINSGNLVFSSAKKPATLAAELQRALQAELGKTIDVAVRSRAQLERILAANPFPDGDPSKVTVSFLMAKPPAGAERALAALATEREPYLIRGTDIYVHYADGLGTSKLAATFAAVVKTSSTTRNVRTVAKVLDLLTAT